jgi:hypothetical protein
MRGDRSDAHARADDKGVEPMHPTSLNQDHVLGNAKDVNFSDLSFHLVIDHNISVTHLKTKSQLGKAHLLAHAVEAYPELRELMNLPPEWGKG